VHIKNEQNPEIVRQKAILLEKENNLLTRKVANLLSELAELRGDNAKQIEMELSKLNRALDDLAKQQEKSVTVPGRSEKLQTEKEKDESSKKPQRGHGPTEQPNLLIVEKHFKVDEPDKICPTCGKELLVWEGKEDRSQLIDIEVRRFLLTEIVREKCRCPDGCCVETATGPPLLIPGGRYTPRFVLESLLMKYVDNIPINKQTTIFRREGLAVNRTTLWDQHWAFVCKMQPFKERLKEHLFEQPVLGADESPWPFIQKGGKQKWQAWSLTCPTGILIEIHKAKSAEVGELVLSGFKNKVIADGAPTYESLRDELGFSLYNCWAHARRKFVECEKTEPEKVKIILKMIAELFHLENKEFPDGIDYRCSREDLDRLHQLRQQKSKPVIKRIHLWLAEQRALPESDFGKAIKYMAKRWIRLTGFLTDPQIPLTNNRTERGYIDLACGRRSYFGSRSLRGVVAAGTMYSLIGSAKLCGLDPRDYLSAAMDAAIEEKTIPLPHELISNQ
jgi:transposase